MAALRVRPPSVVLVVAIVAVVVPGETIARSERTVSCIWLVPISVH